jgi:hypothetical protein
MAQGARRSAPGPLPGEADSTALGCPTEWEHRVEIPSPGGASVTVIALSCPNCTRPSATDELTEIVAARRRTIAGLNGLPPRTRAELATDGTLDRLYLGTIADVHEAAQRCREWLGVELPDRLVDSANSPTPDSAQVAAALDVASEWVAALRAGRP